MVKKKYSKERGQHSKDEKKIKNDGIAKQDSNL